MAAKRKNIPPATTLEGQENRLISLASGLAEKWMVEGTAPAQVVTHFLKLGSTREQLEQQKLLRENLLLAAKVEQIEQTKEIIELHRDAMAAFSRYAGHDTTNYPVNGQ